MKKKRAKKITADEEKAPSRVFLIQFKGDMRATAVNSLREVVTGLLTIATPEDEVVIIIESPGGVVHDYGLAASQLQRLRQHQIPLTAVIDKVAASGGYLMACVANRILCAPFAIVGSIGVIAQLPNFHRLLKQHYIDFEQITGGEFKRTLTMFGRNTNKEREKFQEQVDDIHDQFKTFVSEQRPQMNIEKVATGEYWYGNRALQLNLVDKLTTSDDYLLDASRNKVIYEVSFEEKKTLQDKLSGCIKTCVNTSIATLRQNDREQLHC